MKRAVVYTRISRDPLHTELGVQRQERDCLALCDRLGFEVVEVFHFVSFCGRPIAPQSRLRG